MRSKVWYAAAKAAKEGTPAALVTLTSVRGSTPRKTSTGMLVFANEEIIGTVGGGAFEFYVIHQAYEAIQSKEPRIIRVHLTHDLGMCCGGIMEAFIEPILPQSQLVIYGAGHVGTEVAQLAANLDFAVTVVDNREKWINPKRFPSAVHVLEADPRDVLNQLPTGAHCFHFITTHSHALDQEIVQSILSYNLAWIGMIGSRTKLAKFIIRLRAADMPMALLNKITTPAGLDIGAQTPAEIAVSIVAELIAIRNNKNGDSSQPHASQTDPLLFHENHIIPEKS